MPELLRLNTAGVSAFRIRRPPITTNGFSSDVNSDVGAQLADLNQLLGKRVFKDGLLTPGANFVAPAKPLPKKSLDPVEVLNEPLTPKRIFGNKKWADDSLADRLEDAVADPGDATLSKLIDSTPDLSRLQLAFRQELTDTWSTLGADARTVLDDRYAAIRDYLVAYAYVVRNLKTVDDIKGFVLNSTAGVQNIAQYAVVGAAREIIHRRNLNVEKPNEDDSRVVKDIRAGAPSLTSPTFEAAILDIVGKLTTDSKFSDILKSAKFIGDIPEDIKPKLIRAMKSSPVTIDKSNIDDFLPYLLAEVVDSKDFADDGGVFGTGLSDDAFEVTFLEDDKSAVQVSVGAVKCAAMLYYGMIAGDELEVFNVINYFTHKYLIRGGIEILDEKLRSDLQGYVFSDKFTDPDSGRVLDKTRPAERQMFYRQVFNYGRGQVTEDLIVNHQYNRLWKVMMLESANYLERAQASLNPDSYVSRQKVMQSVEDLQYNLSTNCTGMANVITPLIYAEFNFVVKRILQHPEVVRQIAPQGGTWWRVVERLYMEMKHARPKVTVLYNKARYGSRIIEAVADYTPAAFEDDAKFSDFISLVDAFITTQSILQESLTDDLRGGDEDEDEEPSARKPTSWAGYPGDQSGHFPGVPSFPGIPGGRANGATNGHGPTPVPIGAPSGSGEPPAPGGEWDF
jgi:hypothetical protein